MKKRTPQQAWKITFFGGEEMILTEDKIHSPTIQHHIEAIKNTFACHGVTLTNGIQIEKASGETR